MKRSKDVTIKVPNHFIDDELCDLLQEYKNSRIRMKVPRARASPSYYRFKQLFCTRFDLPCFCCAPIKFAITKQLRSYKDKK